MKGKIILLVSFLMLVSSQSFAMGWKKYAGYAATVLAPTTLIGPTLVGTDAVVEHERRQERRVREANELKELKERQLAEEREESKRYMDMYKKSIEERREISKKMITLNYKRRHKNTQNELLKDRLDMCDLLLDELLEKASSGEYSEDEMEDLFSDYCSQVRELHKFE